MAGLLIAGSRGIPAQYGGFETFVQEIVPVLSVHFSPLVVTGFDKTPRPNAVTVEEVQDDVFVIRLNAKGWHRLQNLILTLKGTRIARKRFKVQHALVLNDVNFLTAFYLKKSGVEVVIHLDGDESARRGIPLPGRMLHKIFRVFATNHIDIIVVDSFALLKKIDIKHQNKVKVIKYGSTDDTYDRAKINYLVGNDEPYLLLIARMVAENNILEIINAVSNSKVDMTLHVIGIGTGNQKYEDSIRKYAKNSPKTIILHQALYDLTMLNTLLKFCSAYIHGHEAGGTNPILVSARNHAPLIFPNENEFNRESSTTKESFWKDSKDLTKLLDNFSELPMITTVMDSIESQPNWDAIAMSIVDLFNQSSSRSLHE